MGVRQVGAGSPRLVEGTPTARRPRSTLVRRAALVLATLAVATLVLAARADAFVYWPFGDTIGRANLDGTGVNPAPSPESVTPAMWPSMALHVYWNNDHDGAIGRANLDGTGVDKSFIATGYPSATGLAVDGEHVYWVSSSAFRRRQRLLALVSARAPQSGAIGRANLDGTGVNDDFISGITPDRCGGRRRPRLLAERPNDRARQPRRHGRRPELHQPAPAPRSARGRRRARLLGEHRQRRDRARQPRRQRASTRASSAGSTG